MIELLALWEEGWLQPDTEAFIWRQLCQAFDVDRCMAVPRRIPARTSVIQYDSVEEAVATSDCELVYLQPERTHQGTRLEEFHHPANACYIFGRAGDNNMRHIKPKTDQIVTIYTPKKVDCFAMNIATVVLYDRMVKQNVHR